MSENRKKAFIGTAIALAATVAAKVISNRKQKKAAKRRWRNEQNEKTRESGIEQMHNLTEQYNNQDYIDSYNDRITLKGGGKVKSNDRVKIAKKMKCGGRKKGFLGMSAEASGEVGNAIQGVGQLATALLTSPVEQKQVISNKTTSAGKTSLQANSYDQPVQQSEQNLQNNPIATDDRIAIAKKLKCGGKTKKLK